MLIQRIQIILGLGTGLLLLAMACRPGPAGKQDQAWLLLDMVHHNPGEALTQSRFTDPQHLADYGYGGMVTNDFTFIHTAIPFDSLPEPLFGPEAPERRWADSVARQVEAHIAACHAAGIEAYYFTDLMVLPEAIRDKYAAETCNAAGKFDLNKPFTQQIHRWMIREVFARFPGLDGLVIRTGETYLHNVPYHTGNNPVLNPRDTAGLMATHRLLIELLREEVCVRLGKTLIYRTWDFGLFHTEPDLYRGITDSIAPHPRLFFAIKHPKGDYHRTFPFNPTLGIGQHPQIVEVQCQREYEGKGAHPNYVMQGVIEGFEEYAGRPGPQGLAALSASVQFAGVWSWSRGGGWVGPYLQNELWCDLNAWVLSQWVQHPDEGEAAIFFRYTSERLGLAPADQQRFRQLALLSAKGVLRGHSSLLAPVNVWWTRDQFLGGINELQASFDLLLEQDLLEPVLAEKALAAAVWDSIVDLSAQIQFPDPETGAYVRGSAEYGQLKYHIIAAGWEVMLRGYAAEKHQTPFPHGLSATLARYDSLWVAYRSLPGRFPQCASLYQPYAFRYQRPHYQDSVGMHSSVAYYRKRVLP